MKSYYNKYEIVDNHIKAMRKKKDLPLIILKSLEPFVNLKGDKFEVIDPKDNLLQIIDKDLDSIFHFTIEKYQNDSSGKFQFLMTRCPKSFVDNKSIQTWVEISGLRAQFEVWLKLLDEYESVNSFFDDPLTKSFEEEFFSELEIIDKKSDTNPFKSSQILLLDTYLEGVENKLDELTTESNSSDIQGIKTEINLLRGNLTNKSQKWVITKLSCIWAKIAKQGPKFIKEFLTESKKELIKQGIKGLIEYAIDKGLNT